MTTSGRSIARRSSPSSAVRAVTVWYSGGGKALGKGCWITGSSSISNRVSMSAPIIHPGQPDKETSPTFTPVHPGDCPPVIFDDPLGRHQPQSKPGFLAGGERLKESGEDVRGNSGPRVRDGQLD